jgi:hypothetical protein
MQKFKELILSGWRYMVYKPNSADLNWRRITKAIFIFVCIVVGIYQLNDNNKLRIEREKNPRYTIGIVTGHYTSDRSRQTTIYYKYMVAGTIYNKEAVVPLADNSPNKGDMYVVQFALNNPKNAVFLFEDILPFSPISIPENGWSEIPTMFSR